MLKITSLKQYIVLLLLLLIIPKMSGQQCNAGIPVPFINTTFGNLSAISKITNCATCKALDADSLVDDNLSNYATAETPSTLASRSVSFRVTDSDTDYSSATFAGYRIDPSGLTIGDDLAVITISTFFNGTLQESVSGSSLSSSSVGAGEYLVGLKTTKTFDAIEISIEASSVSRSIKVFNPVITNYCSGPALTCNTATAVNLPVYPVAVEPSHTGLSGVSVGSISNENNLISSDTSDYASINLLVGLLSSASVSVKDQVTDYPAGTYAGFEIENSSLLNVSALGNLVITTYLNGVKKQEFSGNNSAVNVPLLNATGRFKLGFVTSTAFDEVQISVNQTLALNLGTTKVYNAIFEKFCAGPDLVCNEQTLMSEPTFPVFVNGVNSGIEGVACIGCSIVNIENVVDQNKTNYAVIDLTASVGNTASISVKDQITDYPAGTYAGFEIENANILSVSALGNVVLTTYLNGVKKQQFSGNDTAVNVPLLNNSGRFKLGFVASTPFDEVRISVNQTVGVNLGITKVYNAIFEKFCAGPALPCNTQTSISAPDYPVYVNGRNTGIDGILCVSCAVNNVENVIDNNASNYAQINLTASVGNSGSISVKDQITDYPAGTFAGYVIESPALLNVDALSAITISTYHNGILQEFRVGNSALISVGTNLLVGSSKQTIGFVSTKIFDEVKITVANTVLVSLGIVNVYSPIVQKFCDVDVECNKNYAWSNPEFPVSVDGKLTGINGVACVACTINNIDNVLTADKNDHASVTLGLGAVGSASIAVVDQKFTYPAGTFAGFTIKNIDNLLELNLLKSIIISTYLDGVLSESKSGSSQLINLQLLNLFGSGAGIYNVGFNASKSFDEIRITINPIVGLVNNIYVYGAFVNTSNTSGGTLSCMVIDAVNDSNANPVYGSTGGNTGINVFANDTANGTAINPSAVILTSTPTGPLTINPDGTVTVAPNTPGGTYTITYTICDVLNSSNCDTATVTVFVSAPSIALVKGGAVNGTGKVGDTITYTFTVTNTGNTNLNSIVVDDPVMNIVNLAVTPSSLAPNETGIATYNYTITQLDVDNGKVTNSAKVNAKDSQGNNITDVSGTAIDNNTPTVTNLTPSSSIALVKTGIAGGSGNAGDIITYTFTVTNTGNTTLSNILINDSLTNSNDLAVVPSILAPYQTGIATATYTIKQSDIDNGSVSNTATVKSKDSYGNDVVDTSGTAIDNNTPTVTIITQKPSLALVKSAVVNGNGQKDDTITYTFSVINTGNATLKDVVVNDPLIGGTGLLVSPKDLAPNQTGTGTATYIITQSDVDNGKVTNSATVTGKDPKGNDVTDISGTTVLTNDSTVTVLDPQSNIALVKTAQVNGKGQVGDTITYTFSVTNLGDTTLSNIVIDDVLTNSVALAVSPSSLAPNGVGTATATYFITQADLDNGKVTNSATVKSTDSKGNIVTDISGTTLTTNDKTITLLNQQSSVALVKIGTVNSVAKVGDEINYTLEVKNNGNTTLTDIVVDDPLTNTNLQLSPNSLAPGQTVQVFAKYILSQSDIDAGKVTNTATVTAKDPNNVNVTDISGSTTLTDDPTVTIITPHSSIAMIKVGAVNGIGKAGDTITYTFTITNTGNTTLTGAVINDGLTGTVNLPVSPVILAPNAIGTATVTYTIKQTDVDAGKVTNTATVTAKDPSNANVTDISGSTNQTDDATVTAVTPGSRISIIKVGAVNGSGKAGDTITYTFTVTNTGNTTLTGAVINDVLTGTVNLPVSPVILAPNAIGTATVAYTIKQSDVDAGKVTNTATVTAKDPNNTNVTDISGSTNQTDDTTVTTVTPSSSIAMVKVGAVNGSGKAGDTITYTFTVTNTGNTTLTGAVINDILTGTVNLPVSPVILAPNAIGTAMVTYTIKQSDVDAGKVTNTATVTAKDPSNANVTDISGSTNQTDDATVTAVTPHSSIAIIKVGAVNGSGKAGDTINYTFTVTNTGNTTLTGAVINDTLTGTVNLPVSPVILAPNAIGTVTVTYTIKQSDVDAGKVTNTATVTAKDPKNANVTDISGSTNQTDDATVTTVTPNSSIAMIKVGAVNGAGKAGDTITYTFTVTNTGNTTLTGAVINDVLTGTVNLPVSPVILAPNAIGTATVIYTIKQSDVDAGNVTNTATVTAKDPNNVNITDISGSTNQTDDATVTTVTPNSSIAMIKVGAVNGTGKAGDTITYTFTVTNTGNTTLTGAVINDTLTGTVNLPVSPVILAPNAIGTATVIYTIKQSDVDAGKVTNTATVTAKDPNNTNVTDISGSTNQTDDATVTTVTPNSSIAVIKVGAVNGTGKAGDTITYTFTVTNTGNTTLTGAVINDTLTGTVNLPVSPVILAPNAIGTATVIYTIKQSDVDAGKVTNTATVTAKDPGNGNVTDISGSTNQTDDATVTTVAPSSSIAMIKVGAVNGTGKAGDKVTYTFTVMNTGNTTLTGAVINDALTGTVNLPVSPVILAPNATGTATIIYTIKQSDVDAGKVANTATVTAKDPNNVNVTDISGSSNQTDDVTVTTLPAHSEIALIKVGAVNGTGMAGDTITYIFTVTNTGNTTLTGAVINDVLTGTVNLPVSPVILAPNEVGTAMATYTINQSDVDKGKVTNTATVTAKDSNNVDVTDISGSTNQTNDETVNTVTPNSSIKMIKVGVVNGTGKAGDTITYTFTVTNTGNTTLTGAVINDALTGTVNLPVSPVILAPNEVGTAMVTYIIKQSDVDAGKVTNTATVTAKDSNNVDVSDISGSTNLTDDVTETILSPGAGIEITKDGTYEDTNNDGIANEGDVVNYIFTVKNTGDVALYNIKVTDLNAVVFGGPLAILPAGATDSTTFTAVHSITKSDIEVGYVYNSALVTGSTSDNKDVEDTSSDPSPCTICPAILDCISCTITPISQNASIAIVKKGKFNDENGDGYANAGETITYTFTVKNTGNVKLNNVWIQDVLKGIVMKGDPIILEANASDETTFSAVYTITNSDIAAGRVFNQATVYGTTGLGQVVTDLSDFESFLKDDSTEVPLGDCIIRVFNAVSPDGDGANDFFRIDNIECYPNNRVEIFNRWGVKVFEKEGYINSSDFGFTGISNGRATIDESDGLPSGTYYYVIKYSAKDGKTLDKSGYLMLNRG